MKTILTALMILFSTNLYASDDWLTNIEKAQEQAKAEKKIVLLEFTGSDWCPPCKALKKNVFDTDKFKTYAKENLVLVELDFPRDKNKITKEQSAYNRSQAKKFEVKGYPTVILLDADGKRITRKVGYSARTSVESYIEALTTAITAGITGRPSGRKPDGKHGGKPDGKHGGKPDGEQGGKPDGPPNKIDGKGGKKPNRGILRKPGSKGGKKPNGEQGKKPNGEQGKKPDGEQGGERLNWKELLGLTDEQAKKFHAVMKKFREELEKIDSDKRLNPERKMKARESARKRRNAKLTEILTEEQMKKFRKIWRANARPSNAEGDDSSITPQQRAAMAKLMRLFRSQVRQILKLNLSKEDKNQKIAKLKNIYRQKRSQILSPEQARAWAAKDGVSVSEGGQSAEGSDPGPDPTEVPTIGKLGDDLANKANSLNPEYLVFSPKQKLTQAVPLVIFLHGSGVMGDDIQKVRGPSEQVWKGIEKYKKSPCIVVAPQASKKASEPRGWVPEHLNILLDHLIKTLKVDEKRIYLTGNSMGGYGSWAWGGHNPENFAAIAPISGGLGERGPKDVTPDLNKWAANLAKVPVYAFAGGKDQVVSAERSERMIAAIIKAGGKEAKIKIYPDEGHGASRVVFGGSDFYQWIFSKKRR